MKNERSADVQRSTISYNGKITKTEGLSAGGGNGSEGVGKAPVVVLAGIALLAVASKIIVVSRYTLLNDLIQYGLWFRDMMEHYNFTLSGWYLATNTYLFSDYPVHFLLGLALGMGPFTIRLGGFLVFSLICLMLFMILRRTVGGSAALAGTAAYMALPLFSSRYFFVPSFHSGTTMSTLASLLLLLSILKRGGSAKPFLFLSTALFIYSSLNVFSDYLYIFIFVIPASGTLLAARYLFGTRLLSTKRELLIIAGLALSVAAGFALVYLSENVGLHLALAARNEMIPFTWASLMSALMQFFRDAGAVLGIRFGDSPVSVLSAANCVLVTLAVLQAVHLLLTNRRDEKLFVAIFFLGTTIILSAAYIARKVAHFYYLMPLLYVYIFFLSVCLGSKLSFFGKATRTAALVLLVITASYNIVDGFRAEEPDTFYPDLVRFFRENDLEYGYAHIIHGNITTFLSEGDVKIRPVRFERGVIEPEIFHVKEDWFHYREYDGPTFLLVSDRENDGTFERGFGRLTPEALRKMFGPPAEVLDLENIHVYKWNYNIIQFYWVNAALSP